jgi:uncharacterized protein (DUF849 family)
MPLFRQWSSKTLVRIVNCSGPGALLGGHARVGFETNLFLPDGAPASGNRYLVEAARQAIGARGLAVADATHCAVVGGHQNANSQCAYDTRAL